MNRTTRKLRHARTGHLAGLAAALVITVCAAPSSAKQILSATDHSELTAEISARQVSRIALEGDRIARVIRGPDGFAVEHDAARGDLYLRPLGEAGAGGSPVPVILFIGTEKGFTYRLSLAVAEDDESSSSVRTTCLESPTQRCTPRASLLSPPVSRSSVPDHAP